MSRLSYYNPKWRPTSHFLKKSRERIVRVGALNFQPDRDTDPLSLSHLNTWVRRQIKKCTWKPQWNTILYLHVGENGNVRLQQVLARMWNSHRQEGSAGRQCVWWTEWSPWSHSFKNKYLLSTHCVPGTVVDAGRQNASLPRSWHLSEEERTTNKISR